jgi:hypothetical protein
VALTMLATAARAQDPGLEAAVKATYLYKVAPFIDWPAPPPASGFTICIVGNDTLGGVLDQAVAGQRVKDRPILVRRLAVFADDALCQIVYASGSPAQPVPAILASLRGKPIFTVTDGARETAAKGMLNFVVVDNRIRFGIDDRSAAESGLVISSKLLSLAVNVRPRN